MCSCTYGTLIVSPFSPPPPPPPPLCAPPPPSPSSQMTSCVYCFMEKVLHCLDVQLFVKQISTIGFLIYWESLLSTQGDEIGMLEDFIVAIHDVNALQFKVLLQGRGHPFVMWGVAPSSLCGRGSPVVMGMRTPSPQLSLYYTSNDANIFLLVPFS